MKATRYMLIGGVAAAAGASVALAQPGTGELSDLDTSLKRLFLQSVDLFTVLLVTGSVISVAVMVHCAWEVRRSRFSPRELLGPLRAVIAAGRWAEVRDLVGQDRSMVAKVVSAAVKSPATDSQGVREAAELAASEEAARWFRKIEPLSIIGNLGPLLGLAGTVWGMIIAFTSLGEGGGQANPGYLALGISKALFHTLLGLLLAVPSLVAFGWFRARIDRLCNRAMIEAAGLVEMLPASAEARGGRGGTP